MRLVISQPMLMPWRGMFEQVRLSEQFVFLDDVQLPLGGGRGRGFITRVQIKTAAGVDWLSLPVARADKGSQLIKDCVFQHFRWRGEHLGKIEQAYRRSPHFEPVYESVVRPIYALHTDNVSEFCRHSMKVLCEALGLAPALHLCSSMNVPEGLHSSERVLEICRMVGADEYVSGLGAMNYIDYELFERAGVRINYMAYHGNPYPQLHGAFTPFVSAIDMLFNLGSGARGQLSSPSVYWRDWPHMSGGRPVAAPPAA